MSNCLFYVLWKYWTCGGYIIIRKSKFYPGPHFLWCQSLGDLPVEHYVPKFPRKRIFPPIFFDGEIKNKD